MERRITHTRKTHTKHEYETRIRNSNTELEYETRIRNNRELRIMGIRDENNEFNNHGMKGGQDVSQMK